MARSSINTYTPRRVNDMVAILDGKALGQEIRNKVKNKVDQLYKINGVLPHLVVILIGNDPASETYVSSKEKACLKADIKSTVIRKDENVSNEEIIDLIDKLNADKNVHGILLQLPIPKHLDQDKIIARIFPSKDVDGFTPNNVAKLTIGKPHLVPCTPLGVMRLLDKYGIPIQGKNCVVIGRSQIVGKPMASLLLAANGTVTICHSKTANLSEIARTADILVVAIGKPKMVDDSYIKPGATVIDVGISRIDGKLQGDVDFEKAAMVAGHITPVPGGVGPMTIACLLENTLLCYLNSMENKL